MKQIQIRIGLAALCVLFWTRCLFCQELEQMQMHAVPFALKQLKQTAVDSRDITLYPRSSTLDGTWTTVKIRDWTSGFFPGCLWLAYEESNDPFFLQSAQRWTEGLDPIQRYGGTHDIGFMIYCSYGNGYRMTKNETYKKVILQAAQTLLTRYNPRVGCIKSWDHEKWPYPVIIDNMMNLELLFWASQNGGTRQMYDAAFHHAEQTMRNHFRPDYSTYHVLGYDSTNGTVLTKETHQGYADSSCWARGQAWAVYGFTMAYRFTREKRFLQTAENAADYFIAHLPEDYVPYWDFQAPNIPHEPRDASAAAIAASGLIELSTFETDAYVRLKYFEAAKHILRSLCSPEYLAEGTASKGIINHSTGNRPANTEVDVSMIYGDYYFLEALQRFKHTQIGSIDVAGQQKPGGTLALADNTLTDQEKKDGWILLFDGKTANGWRSPKSDTFPEHGWAIQDGMFIVQTLGGGESSSGGDIITVKKYGNFELLVDFKITEKANSGIKYFVDPDLNKGSGSAIGCEFQILDDERHPDAKLGVKGNRKLAALYDLIPPENVKFNGIGQWNTARILVQGNHVEHWLNGQKTLEYERNNQMWRALVAYSKYKDWPNFGEQPEGHILLQEHGSVVYFKNIKLKPLP